MEENGGIIKILNSDILSKKISFQENSWASISKEITIGDVIEDIKSVRYKDTVSFLRGLIDSGKMEEYKSHKKALPGVTFSGIFKGGRKKENIEIYNSIMILDFDELNEHQLSVVKRSLFDDPYVFCIWESPSKKGIKGLVSLRYDFQVTPENIHESHKCAFRRLEQYFKETSNLILDSSGSDITRLCFVSYDPNLILKNEFMEFEVAELLTVPTLEIEKKATEIKISGKKDALYNPKDRNNPRDRELMNLIIRFLSKRNLSITYSYEDWYKVAMAIANTFTYEIGEKIFIKLSSLDIDKFNEINCKNFLQSCYETRNGAIKFSTIVYFANQKGFKTKKQKESGSEGGR